jgi:hypothetical protein
MIDSLVNMLFRCSHRRLTRPVTAVHTGGAVHEGAYVVCLDCGKQFPYDVRAMKMGKALDRTHPHSVVPPDLPSRHNGKVKAALWTAVPLAAVLVGAALHRRKTVKPAAERPVPPKDAPPA